MTATDSIAVDVREQARSLLRFIDASPSPWHAVEVMASELESRGFARLEETGAWEVRVGGRYYVIRDGSSIISFVVGNRPLPEAGFRIVGAHTDSPGLRVKPVAATQKEGVLRLGVEVYGGPILATFTDRDLSLAGRVQLAGAGEQSSLTRLVRFEQPLLRLPNLAIHMNREVNNTGLRLDSQMELPLLMGLLDSEQAKDPGLHFRNLLAAQLDADPGQILSWELNVYDTQPGAFYGVEQEFLTNSQLDNLASCHAGHSALLAACEADPGATAVCAFFDHEEIGSTSHKGADGSFLPDTLARINAALLGGVEDFARARSASVLLSADMAHAWQPNFAGSYEPDHKAMVNRGPVIKTNCNVRYSTEAVSQAFFAGLCQQEGVPYQVYSHRTDLPCGSTIGPMTAARLGIRSVDVGNPMWAMHSIRESAGVLDHAAMIRVMSRFFRHSPLP